MKAPYESGIKKDFPENATEWIASGGKRCTDVVRSRISPKNRANGTGGSYFSHAQKVAWCG